MSLRGLLAAFLIFGVLGLLIGNQAWGSYGSGDGQFDNPGGVATDAAGDIYVADRDNHRVQKFTSDGAFITKWGSLGSGNGQFDEPWAITVNAGNVYVTDTGNHRVQKFTSDGAFITKWGSNGFGDGQFSSSQAMRGITTDAAGNVYVTDGDHPEFSVGRVQKFTSDGAFITKWGSNGSGDGQFLRPWGIASDSAGNVYVSEWNNHRVQKFTSGGAFVTKWGSGGGGDGQFSVPEGIAIDATGNVYVADAENSRIQKFSSNGLFIKSWGSYGSGPGEFIGPVDVAIDNDGNIYVVEFANHRVQKFTPNGILIPDWGSRTSATAEPPHAPAGFHPPSFPSAVELSRPTLISGPQAKVASRSVTFRFTSSQMGIRFQCKLTGRRVARPLRRWHSCSSPQRYSHLRLGRKVFWVRAARAGSTSAAATWGWTIVKRRQQHSRPDRKRKLLVIPANRRKAFFRPVCRLAKRCRARVRVKAGERILAHGRYSIHAHGSHRVAIGLTRAGRKALAHKGRVRAKLTILDPRTRKRETLPVILRRR